jgi:hypothetical protein
MVYLLGESSAGDSSKYLPTIQRAPGKTLTIQLQDAIEIRLRAHQRRTGSIRQQNDPMCRRRVQLTQASRSIKPKDHVANPARMNNEDGARLICDLMTRNQPVEWLQSKPSKERQISPDRQDGRIHLGVA